MRPIADTVIGFSVALLAAAQLGAAEYNPARTRPAAETESTVERFIVKLRGSSTQASLQVQTSPNGESASAAASAATTQRMKALAGRARVTLESARAIGPNMQMMKVSPLARGEAVADALARLRADSDVEYVVPDRRVYPHTTISNDPRATDQWYLQATEASAIKASVASAIGAWDTTTGANNVVIADIDTGVLFDHPDLGVRLLAGYDFVSGDPDGTFFTANDGNGRDSDASDPGDWVTTTENSAHSNCGGAGNSSWHGTRVSGIIGALTNDAVGVAGITWSGRILPVRVLGKCGGYNSDVLAGMRWAAGLHVDGVPDNTNPAQIVNVSLGGEGTCDSASADVISQLASNGVLVVVSAGNEGGPVDSPANCPGAMGIAGLRHAGTKVGFSSLGPEIALGAPGGNCVNTTGGPCLFSIDTTSNDGTMTPGNSIYTDQTNINVGTSFSAPIVSGIAGLMLAVNSNLKSTQLIARLKEGATKPFPTTSDTGTPPVCHVPTSASDIQAVECSCTTSTCGAGVANALGSVNAALRPIAAIAVQGSVTPGSSVALQGSGSTAANNHSISTYMWTRGGSTISSAPTATVSAPASGTVSVCLTVTDEVGKQDTAKIVIGPTSTTVTSVDVGTSACATTVTLAATDASASETGPDTGTFTLTRSGDVSAALSVAIAVSGTAISGTDYQSIGTNVNFSAGASTATVTVTPIDNTVVGGTKSVILTLQTSATYDVGTPSTATVTIADNDTTVAPSMSSAGGGGGGGGALDWATLLASLVSVALAVWARDRRCRRSALAARPLATTLSGRRARTR